MIYKFLRWFASVGIKFYYKNVFISPNFEVRNNTPTIYASNHPSGFYESLILTTVLKKPIIFLVRSDYVSIKGLMWAFKILKLYPIYRQSEGLKDVSKNREAFSILNKELEKKTPVCIYPEGTTKFNFRIKPIKKGIARLALGAINNGIKDLKITPIAFNFEAPVEFRSNLFINVENSFSVSDYINDKNELPVQLRNLTKEVEDKMREVTIDLKNQHQFDLYKKINSIIVNDYNKNKKLKPYVFNSQLPSVSKELSRKIKDIDEDKFNILNEATNKYFKLLKNIRSTDNAVISPSISFIDGIKYIIGYPIYTIGILLNILPILFALYIRKKKIKQYEYKTVVTVLISQFAYLFYFIFLLILSLIFFSYYGLLVFVLPIIFWYTLNFYDLKRSIRAKQNLKKSKKKEELIELRNSIKSLVISDL